MALGSITSWQIDGETIETVTDFVFLLVFCLFVLFFGLFTLGASVWKIFIAVSLHLLFPKEMGMPDHLTCLLRNLYAGQEATVRTGHGTSDWFQIGKGVHQVCILSPCLFNLYEEYIT